MYGDARPHNQTLQVNTPALSMFCLLFCCITFALRADQEQHDRKDCTVREPFLLSD